VLVPNESAKIPPVSVDAGFSPQTAKRWPGFRHKPRNQNPLRRNSPETEVRYMLINKTVAHFRGVTAWGAVRIGMDVMFSDCRHWLEYDSVALAVLLVGIGIVELIVLSF
jgi:hypothetical protein